MGNIVSMKKTTVFAALAFIILVCCISTRAAEPLKITHGPILGRIGPDHIGIWARTSRPGRFRVRYGRQPGHLVRLSKAVTTRLEHDNTGWVLIDGLEPGTKYYYEVVIPERAGGQDAPGGSFRTLPDAKEVLNAEVNPRGLFNFSFEFACGNQQRKPRAGRSIQPVYDTMLRQIKDEVDFAILNGDWIYEEQRDYPVEDWLSSAAGDTGSKCDLVEIIPNIAGVWQNYKLYLDRGKSLAEWHRNVPSFFVFDDHEILDDIRGTSAFETIGPYSGTSANAHGTTIWDGAIRYSSSSR